MINGSPRTTDTRQSINGLKHLESSPSQVISIKEQLLPSLKVPKEARKAFGGCFDPDNWVFQLVWEEVHHMNLPEMLHAFYYREDRGTYGEHHTSTRGVASFNEGNEGAERKPKGSENHRHQEQGRRVRHRCLQAESDKLISTFILELAQKIFLRIKANIEKMHDPRKPSRDPSPETGVCQQEGRLRGANGAGKKLGKDDQLTAALVAQHLANILIFRALEKLDNTQDALEEALSITKVPEDKSAHRDNIVKREQACSPLDPSKASYWQQRFEKSEAERLGLEDEIVQLRQQVMASRSQSFPGSVLPVPVATIAAKRCFDVMEDRTAYTSTTHDTSHGRQAKRRYLEPPHSTSQVNAQTRLTPPTTPSLDESSFSYFGSSFCSSNGADTQSVHSFQQRES